MMPNCQIPHWIFQSHWKIVRAEVSETGSTVEQFEEPESASYNTDGSANLGNQNNQKYGCYLDMMSGLVMDDRNIQEILAA